MLPVASAVPTALKAIIVTSPEKPAIGIAFVIAPLVPAFPKAIVVTSPEKQTAMEVAFVPAPLVPTALKAIIECSFPFSSDPYLLLLSDDPPNTPIAFANPSVPMFARPCEMILATMG